MGHWGERIWGTGKSTHGALGRLHMGHWEQHTWSTGGGMVFSICSICTKFEIGEFSPSNSLKLESNNTTVIKRSAKQFPSEMATP